MYTFFNIKKLKLSILKTNIRIHTFKKDLNGLIFFFFLGIEDGQTIRIIVNRNEIFVTFRVEKSNYFRRDGCDIHTDAKISISQAILGGSIRVRGIYEDHTVQVCIIYSYVYYSYKQ